MRHRSFRRWITALTLFMGLFTQFQMVFACEFKDGKLQRMCCCDSVGEMSRDCHENDGCDEPQVTLDVDNTVCCEVSYQPVPSATAIAAIAHSPQALLFDPPQLLLGLFTINPIPVSRASLRVYSEIPPRATVAQTYLLTQRFRI